MARIFPERAAVRILRREPSPEGPLDLIVSALRLRNEKPPAGGFSIQS